MLLTRRALFLLLLAAPLLAAATFASWLVYAAGAYLLFLLGMIYLDRRISPGPGEFLLTRTNDPRLSLGAMNLVSVRVENRGGRSVRALVRDEFPVQFQADKIILDSSAVYSPTIVTPGKEPNSGSPVNQKSAVPLRPREPVDLHYHVRPPRRGDYSFGDLNLRWWGVLGMIQRQARFASVAPVKVYPNLLDIRKYELQARKGQLTEIGLRQTRMLGSGTEFERLREYQLDDEFRKIDWKATARRGKPVSREFETERSQTVFALLDVGRLMQSPVADPLISISKGGTSQPLAKVDYSVNAVLMLSYVAGLRGDRVGLLTFADRVVHYLAPRAGKAQFYRMLAVLYGVEAEPVEADYVRAFSYLAAKHKKRSLIIIFTDLASGWAADALVKQVAPLYPRHLPLLVAISDPTVVELAQQLPRDSAGVYQRAVAEQLIDERVLTLEKLRRHGVMTLDVPANQLTLAVVNKYLELKAREGI